MAALALLLNWLMRGMNDVTLDGCDSAIVRISCSSSGSEWLSASLNCETRYDTHTRAVFYKNIFSI